MNWALIPRGMMYLLASSSSAMLINASAQLVLSYLISPEDLGVVALAYTIALFIQLFEQGGVGDLLVRRRTFRVWAIPGFWLALALGVCCCLAIIAAAPIVGKIFSSRQLMWALIVLAPASIPNSLAVVPRAQLSRQLRFKMLAAINLANLAIRLSLTVLLAYCGFGPYSFMIPWPVTSALIAAFLWLWVRPSWAMRPCFRRWRYLIGESSQLLGTDVQRVLLDQSDNMLLGLFRSPAVVGIYWFGFCCSIQLLQLFSLNLMGVLFPALTKLNDQPQSQFSGFMKAQRILAMIGGSACLMQAAVSEPVTHLFLKAKWTPSIIVMQILCVGMATRMVAASSFALMKSQGRFGPLLSIRWSFVALQITGLLLVLSLGGGVAEVAAVVAIVSTVNGLISFYTAILPYDAGWAEVVAVLARPLTIGIASVGTAWLIAQVMEGQGIGYLPQLIEIVIVGSLLNLAMARLWMRSVWDDLWRRVWALLPSGSEIPAGIGSGR